MIYQKPTERPPCVQACPAGIEIPRYLRAIASGKFDEALTIIREKIPFPSVCGRVCAAPCETKCRAGDLERPVTIRALKRFVAERDTRLPELALKINSPTGKRVAIIGAGPAGLTAAYYLAKRGHAVTVFEARPEPGGMMRYGIPAYRLPKSVLDNEIGNLQRLGIEIKTNTTAKKVDDFLNKGFNAVFLATGTGLSQRLGVAGEDASGVIYALNFLSEANSGRKLKPGNKVVVIGGGSVAIDAARTSRRLGAKEVHLICLETRDLTSRDRMRAQDMEITEAEEEGIIIHPCLGIKRILTSNGKATGVETRTCTSVWDKEGRFAPTFSDVPAPAITADTVIVAIGQRANTDDFQGVARARATTIKVNETLETNERGVFAGGDVAIGPATVIEAIQAGRKAAIAIDQYLGGSGVIDEALATPEVEVAPLPPPVPVGERTILPLLPVEERLTDFAEVELPLNEETAMEQAKRCLRCDLPIFADPSKCAGCRTCELRCSLRAEGEFNPIKARIQIRRLVEAADEFTFSFTDECDTCGICARYCPYGALTRQKTKEVA